ncbi:MAG: DUF2442 domain-containing protein [Flavobacteriaceae bacterium]|nr:DUF2442 domain-containing protein [Flavobacteriaceae bacterium]
MNLTKDDIKQVGFKDNNIFLETKNGIVKTMPLRWFKTLEKASDEQRANFTLSPFGIHWEELDEDLSFDGFFTYNKDEIQKTEIQKILSELSFLNLQELGKMSNISPSLLQDYACGVENPSEKQSQEIRQTLRKIGNKILEIA